MMASDTPKMPNNKAMAAASNPKIKGPLVVSGTSLSATPTAPRPRPVPTAVPLVANGSTVLPIAPTAMIVPAIPVFNQAPSSRDTGKDAGNDARRANSGLKTPNLVVNGSLSSAAMFADGLKQAPRQFPQDSPKTDCNSEFGTKASSMDGKSVASTNVLDEKESLRPEDSASVMAATEDDDTSIRGSIIAGSRVGSDLAYRARNLTLGDAIVPDRRPVAPAAMAGSSTGALTPQSSSLDQQHTVSTVPQGPDALNMYQTNPDDKLLDAMKSQRDRIFLLRLETQLINFVTNSKDPYMDVREGPERSLNTFYRMLAHKLADYYHMTHTYEPSADGVRIYRTPFCRVPKSLSDFLASHTPNRNTPPPTIVPRKIMKRGEDMQPGQSESSPTKGPSEAGSDSKDKEKAAPAKEARLTRSEREEAYKLARERIFGNSETDGNDNEGSETRASSTSAKEKSNTGKRGRYARQRRDSDGFDYYCSPYPQQQPWPPQGQYMSIPTGPFPQQIPPVPYVVSGASTYPHPNTSFSPMVPQGPNPYSGHQYSMGPPSGPQFHHQTNQPQRYSPVNGGTSPMMAYGAPVPPSGPQAGFPQQQPPTQPQAMNGGPPFHPPRGPGGSSPLLMPFGIPYAYGQLPANDPKDPNRQHPIPGSYNNRAGGGFNPQTKSFVPGGNRMGPSPVPSGPSVGSMPPAPPFTAPGSQHTSPHVPPSNLTYGGGGYQHPMPPPPGPHFPNGPRQGPMNGPGGMHPHHPYQGPPHGSGPQQMGNQPPIHHHHPPQPHHPSHPQHYPQSQPQSYPQSQPQSYPQGPSSQQLHHSLPPHPPAPAPNHLPSHSPNLPNKPIPQGPAAMVNRLSSYGHPASLPPKPTTGN